MVCLLSLFTLASFSQTLKNGVGEQKPYDEFNDTAFNDLTANKSIADTTKIIPTDSMNMSSTAFPKRSAMLSALIPGLGQMHNHDYWKMYIVYAGLGTAIYFFQDNLRNYNKYNEIYANRTNVNNPNYTDDYSQYSNTQISSLKSYYKRNLQLTVVLTSVGYLLQLAEALAAAHLKGFDISDDLSFYMKPAVLPTPVGLTPGVGLVFKLK